MEIRVCANCGNVIVADGKVIPTCKCLSPDVMTVYGLLTSIYYNSFMLAIVKKFIEDNGLWQIAFDSYCVPYKPDYPKRIKQAVLGQTAVNMHLFADYLLERKDKLFEFMRIFDVTRSINRYKEIRANE